MSCLVTTKKALEWMQPLLTGAQTRQGALLGRKCFSLVGFGATAGAATLGATPGGAWRGLYVVLGSHRGPQARQGTTQFLTPFSAPWEGGH